MPNWYAIPLALVLLGDADVPRVNSLRPPERPLVNFPSDEEIPIFPSAGDSTDGSQAQPKPASTPNQPLQENSKLTLIRFVSGEFAKAVKSLPAGKEGFNLIVGKPLDTQLLNRAVATHGAAVNSGDNVQITGLEFRAHQIVVDLNGDRKSTRLNSSHGYISYAVF